MAAMPVTGISQNTVPRLNWSRNQERRDEAGADDIGDEPRGAASIFDALSPRRKQRGRRSYVRPAGPSR
jgi:hypothetical protein